MVAILSPLVVRDFYRQAGARVKPSGDGSLRNPSVIPREEMGKSIGVQVVHYSAD